MDTFGVGELSSVSCLNKKLYFDRTSFVIKVRNAFSERADFSLIFLSPTWTLTVGATTQSLTDDKIAFYRFLHIFRLSGKFPCKFILRGTQSFHLGIQIKYICVQRNVRELHAR